MQTLILPGYSKENKVWVDEVANNIDVTGIIRPFYWMHWTDENSKFIPQEKANLIVKHVKDETVNIIAKSMGVFIASLVINKIIDRVNKVIFCGIPANDMQPDELDAVKDCVGLLGDRFLGIQNSNDPHGGFEDVKYFRNMISKDGDNHNYPYYEDFREFLVS